LNKFLAAHQPGNIITGEKEKQLPQHDYFQNPSCHFKMLLCLSGTIDDNT
jgi:hypothetical protein